MDLSTTSSDALSGTTELVASQGTSEDDSTTGATDLSSTTEGETSTETQTTEQSDSTTESSTTDSTETSSVSDVSGTTSADETSTSESISSTGEVSTTEASAASSKAVSDGLSTDLEQSTTEIPSISGSSTESSATSDSSSEAGSSTASESATQESGGTTETSAISEDTSASLETSSALPLSSEDGASSVSSDSSSTTEVSESSKDWSSQAITSEGPIFTEMSTLWSEAMFGVTMPSSLDSAIVKEQKMKKCKRKRKSKCLKTEFGCCPDNVTIAQGPFEKGCPKPTTCEETKYGCCSDKVSVALGHNEKGCPPSQCALTLFGCCPDGTSMSLGNDYEGCPEETTLAVDCTSSQYGCCPDGFLMATGPNYEGCYDCEGSGICDSCNDTVYGCCPDGFTAASGPDLIGCDLEVTTTDIFEELDCENSTYGCCPDGFTFPDGPNYEGCVKEEITECNETKFGCCPDGNTTAIGPDNAGCPPVCDESAPFGCCDDGETIAHGPNKEGCCLNTLYGCCPDNIRPAQGPKLEGCGCQYTLYGCCPDNVSLARGPDNEGCGCQYAAHGCCPDKYTPAVGPDYQGCPCYTYQFGCCPDGIRKAKGLYQQGCGCEDTEFRCCPDEKTPAPNPSEGNCTCEASKHGCCLDGSTEATDDNFGGCPNKPRNLSEICLLPKDRGPCREFTIRWFYDIEYGGCSRFWYGSCGGNTNRFKSQSECKSTCVEPQGKDVCLLPKIEGPCKGYYPTWYYDTTNRQCRQFIYGGCLGNGNKFQTREECEEFCHPPDDSDVCDQILDSGPCEGNFTRWYFDKGMQTCTQFKYGGCKGNKNNFLTEIACHAKCLEPGRTREECSLPRSEGDCKERLPKWFFDQSENRCMPFYYSGCGGNRNMFETLGQCEEYCPKKVERDTCLLPALPGECSNYIERYYFDSLESRCKMFYYGGCGGNHNNFLTERDCLKRCDSLSVDSEEVPFTTDMCFLPEVRGPCAGTEGQWYYDSRDGVCKQFLYGGCQGNGNRFKSRHECEHSCGTSQDICTLPRVVGPCDGSHEQWYYDARTDSCHPFDYGGCQGNGNRFNNEVECESRCRKIPRTEVQTRPPAQLPLICQPLVDPGPCLKQYVSWYYERNSGRCQQFIYGGCEGNTNRFQSEEQCERQCGQFRSQDVCSADRDPGPCNMALSKWFFDVGSQSCYEFTYGGCGGNANRFTSQKECEAICVSKEEVPILAGNNTPAVQEAICRLPPEAGNCIGSYRRWYYEEARRSCTIFIYTGCGGNLNSFTSFQACSDYCRPHYQPDPNEIDVETKYGKDQCSTIDAYCEELISTCEYGTERWMDGEGCYNCRCHNPCDSRDQCEVGTKCVVQLVRNEETGDSEYRALCRPVGKAGHCPASVRGTTCTDECSTDADCSGEYKCCFTGCGTSCMRPILPEEPTTPKPEYDIAGAIPPQMSDEADSEVAANEGNYATLRCIVRGSPIPTIYWRRGEQLLNSTGGKYRIFTNGTVQIFNLRRTDSGIYICIAENGIGPAVQKDFRLIINDGIPLNSAVVGEDNSSVVVNLGAPAVLTCYTIGWPHPTVRWWQGSIMLPLSSDVFEVLRDNSLLIHSVTLSNLGPYTCQAYNGVRRAASWTVTLKAIGPVYSQDPNDVTFNQFLLPPPLSPPSHTEDRPRPPPFRRPLPPPPPPTTTTTPQPTPRVFIVPVNATIVLEQLKYRIGDELSIPCDVNGYPVPIVTWYKDDVPVVTSDRIRVTESNRLLVNKLNSTDSGVYKCLAQNSYNYDESAVAIKVEGVHISANCTDNRFLANCQLVVQANFCKHKYYAVFCCKSCTEAGQLSQEPSGDHSRARRSPLVIHKMLPRSQPLPLRKFIRIR